MNALLDAPFPGLGADVAVKGFLVLLAALAATTLMRRASAASRHLVWLAALTGVLMLPVAAAVVPAWRALPPPSELIPPAAVFTGTRLPAASAAGVAADAAAPAPGPVSVIKSNGVLAAPRDPSTAPAPRAAQPVETGDAGWAWRQVALFVWLAGAAILLVRLVGGLLAVWRMERRASQLDDERWTMLTDRLSRRMGLGRIVRLLRGPTSAVPMTWGAFRPVILLPAEADAWDEDRRAAVLAHELAHVRRWDALTQWIAHLAVALFWFNPLVWVAARRVREEREHACDDAVLAVGTRATDYADHLLTIVRALGSAPGPAAALAMARRTHFEGRLRAILDSATPRGTVSRTLAVATSVFALTFIVPLAALRASEGAPEEEAAAARSIEGKARSLGTDAARRDFLLRLVADPALPPMALEEVARASKGIGADADRTQVLDALLERDDLGASALALAIQSAQGMRAQTALAAFLRDVADARPVADGLVCDAFFGALDRLRDPHDLRPVLENVVGQPALDVAVLEEALRVTARLDDASLRVVLARAIQSQPVKGQARPAYLEAARRIRDADWRAEALARLDAEDAAHARRAAAADRAVPDSGVQVVGGDPEWKAQMLASQAELEYHEQHPDSALLRLDARNALMSWRDGASEMDLRAGGYVHFRETRGGVETEVQLREDGRGGVIRVFRVAGVARPWSAEAQAWYERVNQHLYDHMK